MRKHILSYALLGALILPSATTALAVEAPEKKPAATSRKKQPDPHKPDKDGWVRAESGARPAFVGIQGGTARVSLMRAPNGVLVAFTGQTGNDFAQLLRGHDGNGSIKPSQDTDVPQLVAEAPKGQTVTEPATEIKEPASEKAQAAPKVETPAQAAQAPSLSAAKKDAKPAKRESPATPEAIAEAVPPQSPIDQLLPEKDKDGNGKVVFATTTLATRIADSTEVLSPYGLSAGDKDYSFVPEVKKRQKLAKFKPLELRKYNDDATLTVFSN